jgi:hypothetical protein
MEARPAALPPRGRGSGQSLQRDPLPATPAALRAAGSAGSAPSSGCPAPAGPTAQPSHTALRALPRETNLSSHCRVQHRLEYPILLQGLLVRRQHGLPRTYPPRLRVSHQVPCDPRRVPRLDGGRRQNSCLLERRRSYRRLPGGVAHLRSSPPLLQHGTRDGGGLLTTT